MSEVREPLLGGLEAEEAMHLDVPASTPSAPSRSTRRINTRGRSLRAFAARGVIVNTVFDVGLSGLGLLRGFILAALLTPADYGVWGVLVVSLGVLARLKVVGISDKYIQQNEPDQELAFQKAFTLELLMTGAAMVPIAAGLPLIAVIYGHWKLVPPGAVLLTVLAAGALQSPFWVYYRDMDFVKQRTMTALDPVVGFIVAVGLAALGAGYWALAIGVVAGAWTSAIIAMIASPYPLRLRYDRGSLQRYASFSVPIFIATVGSVVLANSAAIASNAALGLGAVGALSLSSTITAFTTRVDDLVSTTLYPAICAVQDRIDLLRESFVKSNRLALMWAMPFGFGMTLFCSDLVHFVLGAKWHDAIALLQVTGIVAAISHIAFNWDDYFRARSNTWPIAIAMIGTTITFLGVGLPLLFLDGLHGLAIGIGAQALVNLFFRAWYITRLFDGFVFVRHAMRAILPTVPGVLVVLLMRALETGPRTAAIAIAEVAAYCVVTIASTWLFERRLLREAVGYIFERASAQVAATG